MDKPSTLGTGGPPSAKAPASVRPATTSRENTMSTHGQERGLGRHQNDQQPEQPPPPPPPPPTGQAPSPGDRNSALEKHQADGGGGGDGDYEYDSDGDKLAGGTMLDRASSGRPVLSSTADLGLDEDDGFLSTRPQQEKSGRAGTRQELPKTGEVPNRIPTPTSPILFGTSLYDPEDETNMTWEHGRRYCRDYFMPNDEDEQDRLRILHQIYLNIFNLELTTIPLQDPTMVLDVGTGTGEWAMGMAERWPDCKVIGVDISPTFEKAIPLNCHFEVMDGEDPWPWPDRSFDMVHYRHMSGTFRDWNQVYSETLRCLKPGGWVEVLEFHDHEGEKSFYDRFPPHSLMHKAARDIERAEVKHGKHRGIDHMEPDVLEANGFVDCEVHEHIIPLDPSNSPLGKLWLVTLRAGFESYGLRLLTKYMGWDAATVRMACDSIGQQMIAMATNPNLNKGFQIRLRVTIARKPLEPKSEPPSSHSVSSITEADWPGSNSTPIPPPSSSPAPASVAYSKEAAAESRPPL